MPARNFTDSQESVIAELYLSGVSSFKLAEQFKVDKFCILSALKRQGVERRKNEVANRKYTVNEKAFDTLTEESAYWLGFLYADGRVARSKVIILELNRKDKYHIQKFADFLGSDSKALNTTAKIKDVEYASARFVVTHKYLGARLGAIGIISHRPDFSKVLTFLTPDYYQHFIRGVFDGDGSAQRNKVICFAGNLDLLTWIRQVLADNTNSNPSITLHKHITANLHYLKYSFGRSTFPIRDYLYSNTKLYLIRKKDIVFSWEKPEPLTRSVLGQFEKRKSSPTLS